MEKGGTGKEDLAERKMKKLFLPPIPLPSRKYRTTIFSPLRDYKGQAFSPFFLDFVVRKEGTQGPLFPVGRGISFPFGCSRRRFFFFS